tara:strand:+ start:39 stop:266 length:228 start_codon:yes stop_codon:yes gene_type:complete
MVLNEDTLKIYRLIIPAEDVEEEATTTITEFLLHRSNEYANRLGKRKWKIKDFAYFVNPQTGEHIFTYYCEKDYI